MARGDELPRTISQECLSSVDYAMPATPCRTTPILTNPGLARPARTREYHMRNQPHNCDVISAGPVREQRIEASKVTSDDLASC